MINEVISSTFKFGVCFSILNPHLNCEVGLIYTFKASKCREHFIARKLGC